MMAEEYPSTLPLPQVAGYAVQTNVGVSSVTFERGNTRQRRNAKRERHVFSLSFVFTTAQLWAWQSWANQKGYDWHLMSLESAKSALVSSETRLIKHSVRYISDISIEALEAGELRVYVSAEMDLDILPGEIIIPSGDFYVAGSPASPSTDIVIGGSPASPSTDYIIAGSPILPAA